MAVVSLFHFVQLTEGRYARDIPKPLPSKKNGSLMYGAGHVFRGVANFHLHDKMMQDSPSDTEFARMLSNNCVLDAPDFPPPAIAEALEDYVDNRFKIRRLHLIIVDTWRPWRYNADQIRAVTDQMWHLDDSPDCQQVVPMRPGQHNVPPRCRRFVYGYALDHSEFPCYLVWPFRDHGGYLLVDTNSKDYLALTAETYFRPLGLQHFYASFALDTNVSLRDEVLKQFQLDPRGCHVGLPRVTICRGPKTVGQPLRAAY